MAYVEWPAVPLVGEHIFITDEWYIVVRRVWSTVPKWLDAHTSEIDPHQIGIELIVKKDNGQS